MTTFRAPLIKGLMPGIDRRVLAGGDAYCVDGENFLVDQYGPYAGGGSELAVLPPLANPEYAQTFRVDDDIFICHKSGILRFDQTSQTYYPVYTTAVTLDLNYPWTCADLGNLHYFAHYGLPLLEWNQTTNVWRELTSFVPAGLVAATQSCGRLILLGSAAVGWSAIGDGSDLTPSLTTGAGTQGLSIIGGSGLALSETATGFLVFTTKGFFRSELSGLASTFRHIRVSSTDILLNSWCATKLPGDITVFATTQGLRSATATTTAGNAGFTNTTGVYAPIFNEFFNRRILPSLNLTVQTIVRLHYNADRDWFILMLSSVGAPNRYSQCYVQYTPRQEAGWGSFNKSITGFGEIYLSDGPNKGFNFGYFTEDGFFHRPREFEYSESAPTTGDPILWHASIFEAPPMVVDGVTRFTTELRGYDRDVANLADHVSGYYTFTSGDPALSLLVQDAIASWVRIGSFRLIDTEFADYLTRITDLQVGSANADTGNDEDWLLGLGTDEDWLASSGNDEDWGTNLVNVLGESFQLTAYGTNDGYNVFNTQTAVLTATASDGSTYFYPVDVMGLFIILLFEAMSAGQNFHVRFLEGAIVPAGRR